MELVYRYGLRTRTDGPYRTVECTCEECPPGEARCQCACGHCPPGQIRCRGRDSARWDLPEAVTTQLELAWSMREDLVSIEHEHEAAMKTMWSSVPEIAATETALEEAEQRVADLTGQARREHSAGRTNVTSEATAAALRQARQQARDLRARRRDQISRHRSGKTAEIAALQTARKDRIIACRQDYAGRGLYWATYNMVLASHQVAVQLVTKRRTEGAPARLRHHRYTRTGTIAVQLQRSGGGIPPEERLRIAELAAQGIRPGGIATILAGEGYPARQPRTIALIVRAIAAGRDPSPQRPADPPRSPELLASGEGKWRNVLQIRPWIPPAEFSQLPRRERRRIARTGEAVITTGGGQTVTLPITVHRMMPPGADVTQATLTITRIAGAWQASLSVTVDVPDPTLRAAGPAVAVHCGWRHRDPGSSAVRVATWAASDPLPPPPAWLPAGIVTHQDGGRSGEIIIPASWMDRAGYPPAVRGIRDTAMAPVLTKTADWLTAHPQEDGPTGAEVRQWRSPGRLAALALRWRTTPPAGDGADEIAAVLEEWRARDRHLWEIEANDRDQLTRRRDNAWRLVAAWLCEHAGRIVTDDSVIADLRRTGDAADDDPVLPEMVAQKARARAALAAPGRLRQLVTAAATRRGIPCAEVPARMLTRTCPHCGQEGDAHPRYAASAVVTCPHCARPYDQDRSAATLMLARAANTTQQP